MPPNADDLAFIAHMTRLQSPPHTPEIQLWLADDLDHVWEAAQQRSGSTNEPIPFWAFAWPGGLAVARYLLDHSSTVSGKRVLDIATGSGLCAIAAHLAGAESAFAADIDPLCGAAVALNAKENEVDVAYIANDLLSGEPPVVDLIIAGDIGYEQALAQRMLAWLERAHRCGVEVLIGDPGRRYFPREAMCLLALFDIETTLELESNTQARAGVYTFPKSP